MRELSLFSGAGGGLLGTKLLGFQHIGYVEFNEYCQKVLAQRIKDGYLDEAPIFTDVREFLQSGAAEQYRGIADVVTAGFPCQPFSVAGKQKAEGDKRNMWPATIDIIRMVRPERVLLENVPGLLSFEYIRTIFRELAEAGYDARWCVLGADDCGAKHHRKRLWILANSKRNKREQSCDREAGRMGRKFKSLAWERDWESALREFRRMDDGLAYRVERIDTIRNGQVPAVAATAWELLNNV